MIEISFFLLPTGPRTKIKFKQIIIQLRPFRGGKNSIPQCNASPLTRYEKKMARWSEEMINFLFGSFSLLFLRKVSGLHKVDPFLSICLRLFIKPYKKNTQDKNRFAIDCLRN